MVASNLARAPAEEVDQDILAEVAYETVNDGTPPSIFLTNRMMRNLMIGAGLTFLPVVSTIAYNVHSMNASVPETANSGLIRSIMEKIIHMTDTPYSQEIYHFLLTGYKDGTLDSPQQLAHLLETICTNNDCSQVPQLQEALHTVDKLLAEQENKQALQLLLLSLPE